MAEFTSQIEAMDIAANGFTFSALSTGPAEGQLVLFLHGWPQFADSWTEAMSEIGDLGYRAVAFDQRGYSTHARPGAIEDYAMDKLVSDVIAVADALDAPKFHLIAHDWGAIVGWHVAEAHADRVLSFTTLAIPHPKPLGEAKRNDPDQRQRGAYVEMFRLPGHVAEKALMGNDAAALRACYQGVIPAAQVEKNVQRFREPGALTAVLNYYRAFDWDSNLGPVSVPTLYIWASNDRALGEVAARNTAAHVTGPYRFEVVPTTHWIVDEIPREVVALVAPHLSAHSVAVSPDRLLEGKKSCPT